MTFTINEILNTINDWKGTPLNSVVLNALLFYFINGDATSYTYKNNNIEDFILETANQILE